MLGRDHEQKGAIAQVDLPGCALVLSSGLSSPAPKKHPNEDAVGVVQTDGGATVGVVADAHFGRESAEMVVQGILSQVFRSEGMGSAHSFIERVSMSFRIVARSLGEQNNESACAVVVAWQCQDTLIWASVGDCRLILVGEDGNPRSVSPVEQTWLGRRYHPRQLHWGREQFGKQDRALLCTDGLPECRYGRETLTIEDLGRLTIQGTPTDAAQALAKAALTAGGEDNIGLLVMASKQVEENIHATG